MDVSCFYGMKIASDPPSTLKNPTNQQTGKKRHNNPLPKKPNNNKNKQRREKAYKPFHSRARGFKCRWQHTDNSAFWVVPKYDLCKELSVSFDGPFRTGTAILSLYAPHTKLLTSFTLSAVIRDRFLCSAAHAIMGPSDFNVRVNEYAFAGLEEERNYF